MHEQQIQHRSVLEFRAAAVEQDGRTWVSGHGVAWDSRNSYGEVFVPGCFTAALARISDAKPLPMRWMHDDVIGKWSDHVEDQAGLRLGGYLSATGKAGDAAVLLRDGAVTGLSVGFWPVRWQYGDPGERVTFPTPFGDRVYDVAEPTIFVLEARLAEVSLVDIPADDDARLSEVREAVLTRARELRCGGAGDLTRTIPVRASDDTLGRVQMSAETSAPAGVEEIKQVVAELRAIREAEVAGRQDFTAAVAAMTDLAAKMEAAGKREVTGYIPGDESAEPTSRLRTRAERAQFALHRGAKRAAAALGRPVEDVAEFQRCSDELTMLSFLLKVDPRQTSYYHEEFVPAVRALDSTTSGKGDEWVPTGLSAQLIERISLPLKVAALFPTIPMPTQPYDVPGVGVSRVRGGKFAENTADTGQTGVKVISAATRKVTLDAKPFGAEMLVSKILEEDSLIPVLPFMQDELIDFLSADIEDAILNGDGDGAHQDADVTGTDDPRRNFDGLRVMGLAQAGTKLDGGSVSALTVALLRSARAKMGRYGLDLANLATILSINSYYQLLSDTNVMTVDKYGPSATVLTGELGKADGVALVVSEYQRIGLNASGVQDGTTTTQTVATTVHRKGFMNGTRRDITLQWLREKYAEYDQDAVMATHRRAFTARYPVATEPTVCVLYNIDA